MKLRLQKWETAQVSELISKILRQQHSDPLGRRTRDAATDGRTARETSSRFDRPGIHQQSREGTCGWRCAGDQLTVEKTGLQFSFHEARALARIPPLQSCAQIYAYVPSHEKPACNSRCGQRVREARNMFAWQMTEVKRKREAIQEAQREQRTVLFCHADGHLSSQECEVATTLSEIQRRVCTPRCVKDDSGSYAVFTEQGSSASQMTAKVMDVIAKLPEGGRATDAVSACTQVKMKDAPKLVKLPKSAQIFGDVYTNGQQHGPVWKTQSFSRAKSVWSFAGLLCERQFEKIYWDLDGKKNRTGSAYSCIESKISSYRYTWMVVRITNLRQSH